MATIDIRFVAEAKFFSYAIDWFTQSSFSHAGIMSVMNGKPVELGSRVAPDKSFTGGAGVQYRPADYAAFAKQITLRFTVTSEQHTAFWKFAEAQVGKPYDKEAIAGLIVGRDWRDPAAWFCSELVCAALETTGIIVKLSADVWWRVTPGTLMLVCEAARAKPLPQAQ